ncbi:MAG TPA: hypothetical protein PKD48_04510 [Sphingopyxis sp.]|nr:hypothetical protein [Sphingopyxis sp.]
MCHDERDGSDPRLAGGALPGRTVTGRAIGAGLILILLFYVKGALAPFLLLAALGGALLKGRSCR